MNLFGWLKRSKMKREIIVNVEKLETRVAIMENGRLEEFEVEHSEQERLVGSIFKGRVQNLENDLQAAFVDIGLKKNAFLHYWDMTPDADALLDDEDEPRKAPKADLTEVVVSFFAKRNSKAKAPISEPRTGITPLNSAMNTIQNSNDFFVSQTS